MQYLALQVQLMIRRLNTSGILLLRLNFLTIGKYDAVKVGCCQLACNWASQCCYWGYRRSLSNRGWFKYDLRIIGN